MANFFVDNNKQKAANEALARGEKDYMQTGLRAPASNTTTTRGGKKASDRKFGSFRYPVARLDNDSDYLEIKIVEYKAPGTDVSGTGQSLRLQSSSDSCMIPSKAKILPSNSSSDISIVCHLELSLQMFLCTLKI